MANQRIQDLIPLTPTVNLVLPVSDGSTTGKVSLSDACGVMTSAQITAALGYTPVSTTSPSIARAWVLFDTSRNDAGGSDTANTARFIVNQHNFTSVTKTATGKYTFILSQALPNINCAVIGNVGGNQGAAHVNGGIVVGGILSNTTGWVYTWDDSQFAYYDTSTTQKLTSLIIFGN
jgi:hypothetical protein